MTRFLFLIPLLPLIGFVVNYAFGVRMMRRRLGLPGPGLGRWPGPAGEHAAAAHVAPEHDVHAADVHVHADPTLQGAGHHVPADAHGGHGAAHGKPPAIIGIIACGTVLLSFLTSVYAVWLAHRAPGHTLVETLWTWVPGGAVETAAGTAPFVVDWAYQVDPLSSVMLLVVTFVGFWIHVYSTGYMSHDPGYARYMAYLNLFMFAMLTLVLGANYLMLFVGWEGVGLCSYLLIGFWFDRKSASDAGMKAFIVNRIGDAGFVLGMFLIFVTFGSLDFRTVTEAAVRMPVDWAWSGALTMIGLFLFVGACGKSAQIPLYVWLPDAMEGPTPVSALIHAATMVTAGVYMVARSSAIYSHAPKAMLVVAVIGALTAILAATIGLVQNDIKRVLAYSTVSQLGYMFLACGVGAFAAGIFHLMTHAFFKALLFLGSGSVIHGMSGEQDMRRMGGLKAKMPWTRLTMLIGCVAIAGIPPLAGFFSKDEILWSAFKIGGYGRVVWALGFVVAGLTAFYMFRLYHMTFSGEFRGTPEQAAHVHESPSSMILPLQVLAAGSVLAGLVGIPHVIGHLVHVPNAFEHFLEPVMEPARGALREVHAASAPGEATEWMLMGLSVAVGALGIFVARRLFRARGAAPDPLEASAPALYRVLLNKYYVDELYGRLFVRGAAIGGGGALHGVDRFVIDGGDGEVRPGLGVNGLAWVTRDVVAWFSNVWDRYVVDGIVNLTAAILDNLSYVFRAAQNGLVQHYALAMFIAVLFMIGVGSQFVL
jgi:NADH-quinone oxidoreductase subunit L